jgi:predicted permease
MRARGRTPRSHRRTDAVRRAGQVTPNCAKFNQLRGMWLEAAAPASRLSCDPASAPAVTGSPEELHRVIVKDLRHAFRTMAARPAFTAVAVLSLALGIGANTAIFSLWNAVLHAPLPGVENPDGLVMLTTPDASGLWRGRWNSSVDGPRSWVSYAEFEQLRDETPAFAMLMASQSSLNTWRVRVDGGQPEQARGRLVSGQFFQVFGVQAALGRLFTAAEDEGEPSYAVISHAYWQRRFGGRRDVLGTTLRFRDTPVTVVGVAPARFVGESTGQLPDVWLPLRLQPAVAGGADWLQDTPPDKVMWLHLFARLRSGVTSAEAETQANNVFRGGLESFYGSSAGDRRREFLDQRLQLHPGARGVSSTVRRFSSSLTMLLVAVGVLLLIACANLANLLLARGAARQGEMAVRISLGASRRRLVIQLVTESLALAAIGGVAAIALASVFHSLLVQMLQQAEPDLFVPFVSSVRVLAFAFAATLAAGLTFGVLPAWQLTRTESGAHPNASGRGTIGSVRELRSGRWLVGVQLALSLPLLVGAGLLVRTVYNLQHPDLGFRADRLLLVDVDLREIALDVARRDRVLHELRLRLEQVPGVQAASFSQLGLLRDALSTAGIEVEGSIETKERARDSALDRVGADYFTTLGIPIVRGRDISESDRADSSKVCIVNEAFLRRFFEGRDPIGRHVTTVGDDNERVAYEVVGVARDARTHSLRADVEPRFFVPAEQRGSQAGTRMFLVRTAGASPAVTAAVREAVDGLDANVAISTVTTSEELLARESAEERAIARLAAAFGLVALALAALGLYGLLAYGVSRRRSEIAIRIALGAQSRGVIAMILRESIGLVAAGLAVGGALAYFGSRLVATRLYGVSTQDPVTLTAATATLLVVALAAAYVPARRASRVDPMAALHHM